MYVYLSLKFDTFFQVAKQFMEPLVLAMVMNSKQIILNVETKNVTSCEKTFLSSNCSSLMKFP